MDVYSDSSENSVDMATNSTDGADSSPPDVDQSGPLRDHAEVPTGKTQLCRRGRPKGSKNKQIVVEVTERADSEPSKAFIRRARLTTDYGADMIASDSGLKGETRPRSDGYLDWKVPETGKWLPAAPHELFRKEFIEADESNLPYEIPPERGLQNLDVTSNCSKLGQNKWDFTIDGLEDIIDGEGNQVMMLEQPPRRVLEYPQPGYWRYKGLIMLDPDDHAVLDWTCIPKTFSSKLEGGRIEVLKRVFPWLRSADLRARMPRTIQIDADTFGPLPKYSTFSQRMIRFRGKTHCSPWTHRIDIADRWRRNHQTVYKFNDRPHDGVEDGSRDIFDPESAKDSVRSTVSPLEGQLASDTPNAGLGISWLTDVQSFASTSSQGTQNIETFDYAPPELPIQPAISPHLQSPEISTMDYQLDEIDLRFAKPQNSDDDMHIKQALHVTRTDFRSIHNTFAPITPNGESYFTQYQIIQAKHAELWIFDDNPPLLISLAEWHGTFESWPTPYLSQEQLRRLLVTAEMPQLYPPLQ